MSASNKLIQAAAGVGGEEADADFANTVLLLNADDASNGGQNNTFLDSSSNTHTITRNGNVTQGSFSPFSVDDGKWGNYFDGSGDYLSVPSSTDFAFGTGDYTVELWVYPQALNLQRAFVDINNSTWQLYNNTSGQIIFFNGAIRITSSAITNNSWYHIALTRSGTDTKLFIDGVQEGSTYTDSTNYSGPYALAVADRVNGGLSEFNGFMSNLRVVKGTAVYTSAFTPSTTPLTDVSGTSLLTCQSNRFVDNSSNAHSITVNGDPEVVPFSPFPQTTAYDASTNGGSGYFDGSGDYLTAAADADFQFGTGDFTVEAWVYVNSTAKHKIFDNVTPGVSGTTAGRFLLLIENTQVLKYYNPSEGFKSTTNTIDVNSWNHVAVARSGTTIKMFINGVEGFSGTSSTNFSLQNCRIGQDAASGGAGLGDYNGYISNLRIVKGTAVYTSSFTPPTAPVTDVTNTSLLTSFTNASIVDATGKNVLETVGNAQVDTTTVKYGTGSMEFDGTGDYLVFPASEQLKMGTGDFTIEYWVYWNGGAFGTYKTIVDTRLGSASTATGFFLGTKSGNPVFYTNGNDRILSSTALSGSTWYHIALTRSGGSTKLFVDGTQVGSTYSDSGNYTDAPMFIGSQFSQNSSLFWNGYIDDLRITKGIARYTANFTPPEAALPVIGE